MNKEIITIGILLVILFILIRVIISKNWIIVEMAHSKKSQSVKYGQMSEQFMPFLKNYPYNPQNFRFIGKPIDGIQFEEDKIIFIEFKTNKSRMSEKQGNIKSLIEFNKIYFEEYRI